MKLSKSQIEALKKMSLTEPKCAYDLQTTMNTMYALLRKSLIKRINYDKPTWLGWESTEYEFVLTKKGLNELEKEA